MTVIVLFGGVAREILSVQHLDGNISLSKKRNLCNISSSFHTF